MTKKIIPNYDGKYSITLNGEVWSDHTKKFLKACSDRDGYHRVNLSKDNKLKSVYIHRLMLLVFQGASKLCVNHINGIKTDNRLDNLEYCTHSENMIHAYKTGLKTATKPMAKLSRREVFNIKYLETDSAKIVAKKYGVSRDNVYKIRTSALWADVTRESMS